MSAVPPGGVRAEAVSAAYRRRQEPVLRDVTLRAPPGHVTAVVGPNGAGKTTLFRVLMGFLPPRSGVVTIAGYRPERFRRRNGIALLPERTPVPAGWTFRALVEEGCDLHGLRGDGRRRARRRAWERSDLDERQRRTPLARLSKGQARRAVLAFALIGEPHLVLLDEPLSGLDPAGRARLRAVLSDLAASGSTVVMTSHELGEVARLADRAVVLRGGRTVETLEDPGDAAALERAVLDAGAVPRRAGPEGR
ncbi:MAG: ABC transporter ATP-binding protein [Gemmatimonadota bacterium]|jgi:ABC-2 type transport system ATP-binding protein